MRHPGQVLRKWRKERKISIEQVAEDSGIDKGTISRFERGGDFRQKTFDALLTSLGETQERVYAELAGKQSEPAPSVDLGMCCESHADLHRWFSEILHAENFKEKADWLCGNVKAFRELLEKSGGSPEQHDLRTDLGREIPIDKAIRDKTARERRRKTGGKG